jgi:transposase, IS30 family
MSSRRVKKGPGRRPQSAKRQRFVELRERGWSILAAAREVGVSRTAGNNWSRGYKTYRHGQVAGFVPALERLAVRQISARYLSQDERIEIADLRHAAAWSASARTACSPRRSSAASSSASALSPPR